MKQKFPNIITKPNCALDRLTILCLYVPGFQRQVFKRYKILPQRLKKMKEQKIEVILVRPAKTRTVRLKTWYNKQFLKSSNGEVEKVKKKNRIFFLMSKAIKKMQLQKQNKNRKK